MTKIDVISKGTLSSCLIRRFLVESAIAYPVEIGDPNMTDWPIKLAKHADIFCTRRADSSLSSALFTYLNIKTRVGYLPFVCTLPECEKGTAYRLHEMYRQTAWQQGMTTLHLEVLQSNQHAIKFYMRQGYSIVENRSERNRYLMELLLSSTFLHG